jgi:hypothetical protein
MIVVKVELWPYGDRSKAKELGRTYIANVGGSLTRGNYEVAVCKKGTTECPLVSDKIKAARTGEIKNYPRLTYNMWRLIIRSLLSAFPEEKKPNNVEELEKIDKEEV